MKNIENFRQRIFEISRIYKKVDLKRLNTLIYNNQNNKKLKIKLKNF